MSLFPIPKGVVDKIIAIQRRFLWNGNSTKRAMPIVAWNIIELPKSLGGLGIGNIHQKNAGLLFKWVWRFLREPESLWRQVVQIKYGIKQNFTTHDLAAYSSGGSWNSVCKLILKTPQTKALALHKVRKRIGNGSNTLFWHDLWVGEVPLKSLCPRLFRLSLQQEAHVSSCGFWDGVHWNWSLIWCRSLRPHDRTEHSLLMKIINRAVLHKDGLDQLIWTPSKLGAFSVKSFTMELAQMSNSGSYDAFKGLWKGLVPFRIEIFVWFVLLGRINTKAKLGKLGLIPRSESDCIFCRESEEDTNHLFMDCRFAKEIWLWWLQLWHISWVFPSSISELYIQWPSPLKGIFFRKVWNASFFIILWSIWKERNSRIFEGIARPTSYTKELILLRLGWWIKGWGDPFPYNAEEIARNPSCLQWNAPSKVPKPVTTSSGQEFWTPPPSGTLKWNVDASIKIFHFSSAIGGVLRDHNGAFICMFSSPVPFMEINNAEVLAIHRALKISSSSARTNVSPIIIESDSSNAVNWCNKKSDGPWNLNFIINFIRNSRNQDPGVSIIYKSRGTNIVADMLAKQGLTRNDEFLAWI